MVQARTEQLAQIYADTIASVRRDELRLVQVFYPDLTDEKAERYIEKIRRTQFLWFVKERENGRKNDENSIAPGLVAIVTAEAVMDFHAMIAGEPEKENRTEQMGRLITKFGGQIDEEQTEQLMRHAQQDDEADTLSDQEYATLRNNGSRQPFFNRYEVGDGREVFQMSMPNGAYRASTNGIVFYSHVEFSEGMFYDLSGGFKLSESTVVRVEGYEGELWQNPTHLGRGNN